MGRIATGFTFSHQVFGEGFYMMDILVKRLSDSEDRIPVMVSERLIDITQDYVGEYIEIHGQFRSYKTCAFGICQGSEICGRGRGIHTGQSDFSGRIYLQTACIQKNSAGKRNCGSSDGSQPSLRKIRLHTMYMLGKKCQICFGF